MNRERFSADVRRQGEEAAIYLRGELDDAAAAQARAALDEALGGAPRALVLDLGQLEFMDSAGIWLVIETHRRCVAQEIELRLAGERRPAVTHALELAGVDNLIRAEGNGNGASTAGGAQAPVHLRLYLSSRSATGQSVAQAFRAATSRLPADAVETEVIDVFADPARAQRDRVIATPTLIKVQPEPELRLIGSIGDEDTILQYLGLSHLAA